MLEALVDVEQTVGVGDGAVGCAGGVAQRDAPHVVLDESSSVHAGGVHAGGVHAGGGGWMLTKLALSSWDILHIHSDYY